MWDVFVQMRSDIARRESYELNFIVYAPYIFFIIIEITVKKGTWPIRILIYQIDYLKVDDAQENVTNKGNENIFWGDLNMDKLTRENEFKNNPMDMYDHPY